jgi:hypothetical protein
MWNLCPLDVLKLVVSVLTPLVIATVGFFINRSIQRQNDIAQRQLLWRTKWTDDFFKTATGFNDSATRFMLLYVSAGWEAMENLPEGKDPGNQKLPPDIYRPLSVELNRGWLELTKFVAFAENNGRDLEKAATRVLSEAASWCKNGGGDIAITREFQQKQLVFNKIAKEAHSELLGLEDSK